MTELIQHQNLVDIGCSAYNHVFKITDQRFFEVKNNKKKHDFKILCAKKWNLVFGANTYTSCEDE